MMPYGDIDLGQPWLRWWLAAWWHQAITCTNADFPLTRNPLAFIPGFCLPEYKRYQSPSRVQSFTFKITAASGHNGLSKRFAAVCYYYLHKTGVCHTKFTQHCFMGQVFHKLMKNKCRKCLHVHRKRTYQTDKSNKSEICNFSFADILIQFIITTFYKMLPWSNKRVS